MRAPNPAMVARTQSVELDEGRPWSGDRYDEGPVSDPQSAYAIFAGGEDTEAWLDRAEDGTLTGWLREGGDLYRYPDAEAWALDVDGAQMQRADAAPVPAMEGDPNADPTVDPTVDPAADPAADPTVDPEVDPITGEPLTPGPEGDPHIGERGGEGFEDEPDPAADLPDPTKPVEDPTNLPDGLAPGVPAVEEAAAQEEAAADDTEEEFENPFADMLAAPPGTPGDEAPEDPEDPEVDPDAEPDPEDDDPFTDDEPAPEDEDPEDEAAKKKRKRFGGRVEKKHMPGKHNQDDHGNWADDGVAAAGKIADKIGDALDGGSPRKAAGTAPKGGSSTSAPSKSPSKASLSKDSLAAMSNEDLDAMMQSGDFYDMATIEAAADELDSRDDIDARTRGFHKHTTPGSPEEHALFDSIIPAEWSAWAAGATKVRKRSKEKEIADAFEEFAAAQYALYQTENRPYFQRQFKDKPPFPEEQWFAGNAKRGSYLKKYGSEELQRFFAEHPPMNLSDFKAEFYPSYARAKAKVGSRYLSEHG